VVRWVPGREKKKKKKAQLLQLHKKKSAEVSDPKSEKSIIKEKKSCHPRGRFVLADIVIVREAGHVCEQRVAGAIDEVREGDGGGMEIPALGGGGACIWRWGGWVFLVRYLLSFGQFLPPLGETWFSQLCSTR
jgi:hypothetical protein